MADYEYNSDDGWSDPENEIEQDDTEIQIENNYYQADEIKHTKPKEALEKFEVVVMMEESADKSKWQDKLKKFKALQNIVSLYSKMGDFDKMIKNHRKLLKMINQVSRNEATEAIDQAIEAISSIEDAKIEEEFYSITLDQLKTTNEKLWFNLNLKMSRIKLSTGKYKEMFIILDELKMYLKKKPLNEQTKSQLLEIISIEIQACEQIQDLDRVKVLQQEVAPLMNAAILEPRPMAVIKESSGKIAMRFKNWDLALSEFNSAFQFYQDIGDHQAKQILKYVVLAGMLSGSEINPFESKEAKAQNQFDISFKEDNEILAMINLRDSYEQNNIFNTRRVINEKKNHIKDDPFLAQFLGELVTNIQLNMLELKIKSYSRIKISTLARAIGEDVKKTEHLLAVLILDHRTNGMIDQIGGFFERDVAATDSQLMDSFGSMLHQLQTSFEQGHMRGHAMFFH